MRAALNLRTLLCLLVAIGLIAEPGVRLPDETGGGDAQSWRDVRQVPVAVARGVHVEVLASRPGDDEGQPSKSGDGDAGPALRTRAASATIHGESVAWTVATRDARVLIALPHLRVNGCANACGARA